MSRGDDGYTDEERADGHKLYGTVVLVAIFTLMVVTLIGLAIGASNEVAVIVGAAFSLVLTFNVKRTLERKYREKHPGIG